MGIMKLTRGRMRHLAAMGYLIETGVDQYKLTNFTRSMALPQISGGYTTLSVSNRKFSILFLSLEADEIHIGLVK